jgi:hypothetical protein
MASLNWVLCRAVDFPYESPFDLLQIGWGYDSLHDNNIERLHK